MSVGVRHDDLRRRNRGLVIAAMRRPGLPSRTEIAARSGLSHSTISSISSDLIAERILIEAKSAEGALLKRGRPQIALAPNPDVASIVAVVLSLNSLSASAIDYAGTVMAEEHVGLDTLTIGRDELAGEVVAIVRRVIARRPPSAGPVLRIALAVQGTTDAAARSMLWSPITPHRDLDFAGPLEAAFAVPVTAENDCNMMAVALPWLDPELYRNDFIAILLSHGIGMGLMLNGKLFTGTRSSGGEFGHMVHRPDGALCRCGRRGCIEAYAGNYAIWRSARQGSELDRPVSDIGDGDILALAEAARAGGEAEREAFRRAGEALGFGLGSLFALIDPAPVAFVGVGASCFDLIEPALLEAMARTAGGEHSGAISLAALPEELPLIRQGCAMRALTYVDDLFAARSPGQALDAGRQVA